jgi:hypothetical protein
LDKPHGAVASVRGVLRTSGAAVKIDVSIPDVLVVIGSLLLLTGLACWSIPLALVVLGGGLLAAGILMHVNGREPVDVAKLPDESEPKPEE